jgi:hypothetical protein
MPTRTINCPVCSTPMQKKVVRNGVEVDYCDWHGLWLDAGELEQLMPVQEHAPAVRKPQVGKAIAQNLAGAAVMGAGFGLGHRLVGGLIDGLFRGR